MKCEKYLVNLAGKEKNIFVIGETHLYNFSESKWAEDFLNKEHVDFVFTEYVRLGYAKPLYNLFIVIGKYLLGRNYPSLLDIAKKKQIPIKYLEEGELDIPKRTQIIWISVLVVTSIVPLAKFNLIPIPKTLNSLLFIGVMFLASWVAFFADLRSLSKRRENTMSTNMISYIKGLNFKSTVVLVGKLHFNPIVVALKKEFNL